MINIVITSSGEFSLSEPVGWRTNEGSVTQIECNYKQPAVHCCMVISDHTGHTEEMFAKGL